EHCQIKEGVSLLSPMFIYSNATATIVDPMRKTTRSFVLMGPMEQISSSRFQNPLSLGQSLVVVYPHLAALIALSLICFAVSYSIFMMQEIRT
ncbi:MAG: ABC transporter permease, partial [Deltaproteobacteria bacterium]|nr:ABC transporter permease [Deltaproteobacteria bacterium]